MIAGVPASVVSQWKVDDNASPKLMKAFYENLQHGENVSTALQSAMLQLSDPMSENANNIFKWGPFLVWGLPSVQLPPELLTETARKACPGRQRAESLRGAFRLVISKTTRMRLLNELKAVSTYLETMAKACVLDDDIIIDAIVATETLLEIACRLQASSNDVIALAQEFYELLPIEQFKSIEGALESRYSFGFGCGSPSRICLIRYEACNILLVFVFSFLSPRVTYRLKASRIHSKLIDKCRSHYVRMCTQFGILELNIWDFNLI